MAAFGLAVAAAALSSPASPPNRKNCDVYLSHPTNGEGTIHALLLALWRMPHRTAGPIEMGLASI
jgi:hypothetical protein